MRLAGYAFRNVGPMRPNRALAGLLALATIFLAAAGEALVLTHTAGALGLILLALCARGRIVAWIALGAPRTRRDISA